MINSLCRQVAIDTGGISKDDNNYTSRYYGDIVDSRVIERTFSAYPGANAGFARAQIRG
jgi:sugar/nucleoside kinase (ribokinase family)